MGRLVRLVVALGLEEEVARLARDHRHEPADEAGGGRLREEQHVGAQEAQRAHEMQGLVDAAVVVIAVVVPPLFRECTPKAIHARIVVMRVDGAATKA